MRFNIFKNTVNRRNLNKEDGIQYIHKSDYNELIKVFDKVFPDTIGFNEKYIIKNSNIKISRVFILNNEIIGFYMLKDLSNNENKNIILLLNSLGYNFNINNYKGLEGVALGVIPELKSLGYGKKLLNYVYDDLTPKYDFIFGQHFDHLNNLKQWKKKRIILSNPKDEVHISFQFLDNKLQNKLMNNEI